MGSVEPGLNADPAADAIRFTFRSPLEMGAVYDLDLASGELDLVGRQECAGVDAFACERVEVIY